MRKTIDEFWAEQPERKVIFLLLKDFAKMHYLHDLNRLNIDSESLGDFCDYYRNIAYITKMSYRDIDKYVNFGINKVLKLLKDLETYGIIKIITDRVNDDGGNATNLYVILPGYFSPNGLL